MRAVTGSGDRRCAAWIAGALILGALIAGGGPSRAQSTSALPELGDTSAGVLSTLEEKRLGQQFMRAARLQLRFIDDPELTAYIDALGRRLVAQSDAPERDYRFYLVEDPNLNAFAAPGGHIAVHSGLIMAASSESELAGVLAHEVAHVTQRHLPRMIEQSKRQSLPATAAMVAAILLGGQVGQAAIAATNAALIDSQLRYSRDFEREADAIGIRTLNAAGYDPEGMVAFFKRMEQWSRIQDSSGVPEFLRTHPLTPDRVAEAESRAARYARGESAEGTDFLHIRNKIYATLGTRPDDIVRYFEEKLRDGSAPDAAVARYGYALALLRGAHFERAREEITRLVAASPDYVPYRIAQGQAEVAAGNFDAALEIFDDTLRAHPDHDALAQYYADALMKSGRAADAKPLLRERIRANPGDPRLYAMFARAAGESGALFESYQALAEHHYLSGDLERALDQLYTARRHAGDSFYAMASVDARIQEIQDELRRLRDN